MCKEIYVKELFIDKILTILTNLLKIICKYNINQNNFNVSLYNSNNEYACI